MGSAEGEKAWLISSLSGILGAQSLDWLCFDLSFCGKQGTVVWATTFIAALFFKANDRLAINILAAKVLSTFACYLIALVWLTAHNKPLLYKLLASFIFVKHITPFIWRPRLKQSVLCFENCMFSRMQSKKNYKILMLLAYL